MSDLIEREAAISYAMSGAIRREDGEYWIRTKEVRQSLLNMPSAQPEEIDSESEKVELKKMCEELKAHIEYLRRQNDSMKGEIKALIFAVRCCGVSETRCSMRAIDPIDRIALMEKLGIGKECTVCEQNSDPYCKWKPDVVDVCEAICTVPTIEPRCETCEAFNKTRLLIPQPERKKGHWIRHPEQRNIFNGKTIECSECHEKYTVQYVEDEWFCRHCGADMREDAEEPKKCDTCKHVKEPWFKRCADCSDFELWEQRCEK